ncbi:amino acid adenylation domain-containing protein [Streptomyces sp. ACA25]|uniref:non-ribosomal peptide synthetase n=1 Tax=Streptomyces sp. ACA25 TaxID=3022596 RepID=UPI002307AA9B|nr:non-ribosomal peptide synthetase [Streptomyces sp. ACA25]MDB1088335.1 amino acid adenylation domain-containing protein [Streptomyces sp. ACA25]
MVERKAHEPDGDLCLDQLFAAQAARTPQNTAVSCAGDALSYAELDARATALAARLTRLGAGPERFVALLMPRSIDMIVSILAVLRTGAGYVPIDPGYPAERVAYMLADAAPVAAVTVSEAGTRLEGTDSRIPWLLLDDPDSDEDVRARAAHVPGGAAFRRFADSPAYMIYTSGSTGNPKGVVVGHRSVTRLFTSTAHWYGFTERDVWPLFHSFAFDVSVWEIWGALLHGGRLVVVPQAVTRSPADFLRLLAEERVTVLNQTPSAFYQLLGADREHPELSAALALRYVIFAGEALDFRRLGDWYARHAEDAPRLVNMYGITETTVHASHLVLDRRTAGEAQESRVGGPIPDLAFHVLDENLRPVPPGTEGELYVAGPGLARNYAGRPDLTAGRFVACPFGPPGTRMYRSGDLMRPDADGGLEYRGRIDTQVKVRGFRIELGEIEETLAREPGIGQAVVVVREDRPGDRRLVAYAVPSGDRSAVPGPSRLRAAVARRLPSHMVPAAFRILDSLPLTVNGKLDRKALPAPRRQDSVDSDLVAPRDGREETLAHIWQEVLGLGRTGVTDDFFDLGGDSLSAARVLTRVRTTLGTALPARALFESRTIEELAARPEWLTRESEPGIPPAPRTDEPPLSPTQRRFWFLQEFRPGSAEYHVHSAWRLRGPVDTGALQLALQRLAERHEPLRTTFPARDGRPRAVVGAASPECVPLVLADLSGTGGESREAEQRRVLREEVSRPFDLHSGPVMRALLLRREARDHVLVLGLHHIVTDGWSTGIVAEELSALYAAALEGRDAGLDPLTARYADFAAWQLTRLDEERLAPQLAYWRERLAGLEPLALPTDRARPTVRSAEGAAHRFTLDRALVQELREVSAAGGATLFMTLVAACQVLLARYSGQQDVAVGTAVSGRDHPDTERLVGAFINTLVLRSTVTGDIPFTELLAQVRETVLGAFAHQDVPFDRLVDELSEERDPSRTPLVQALVVLQNAPAGIAELAGARAERLALPRTATVLDLTVEFTERAEALEVMFEYSTSLFDAATIERMAAHLRVLLTAVTAEPARPVGDLPLLSDDEQRELLSAPGRPAAGDRAPAHHLFREHSRRTPGAIAVSCGDLELSYAELDERANRLAHRLRELAVGPDVPVVLSLERRPELLVAMVAVLKAGGAYVPVPPDLPAERLRFVVRDTKAPVLLTTGRADGRLPDTDATVIDLDADWPQIAQLPADEPTVTVGPENLAYIIYTSGSTGAPKGVMIPHRGLSELCAWHVRAYRVGPQDRGSQVAGLGFDATAWEIWPYLSAGARIDLPGPDTLGQPAALVSWFARMGTTICFLPTPLAEVLLDEPGLAGTRLRTVLVGGDALRRRPPHGLPCTLVNNYGPTEATVVATAGAVAPADDSTAGRPISIGLPVDDLTAYVLDGRGHPVPTGVPGELHLAGDGLARGYASRPDLTAERFVACPFGPPGARMYRTGDLVRRLPDGSLDYLGRTDQQVKLRGFRIELGEIETVITRQEEVAQAVVVVSSDGARGQRLVGYVVPEPGRNVSAEALTGEISGFLPEYMVPRTFVVLDGMPLTPNGKIDRKALPAPPEDRADPAGYTAPATVLERMLATIWAEVIDVPRVGTDDNFFGLGGDSILSLQVVARARRAGLRLTSQDIFRWPTVGELALRVASGTGGPERRTGSPDAPGRPEAGHLDAPLTPIQHLLLDGTLNGGADPRIFNQYVWTEPAAGIDEPALRRALGAVLERHEALRHRFTGTGDRWRQSHAPQAGTDVLSVVRLPGTGPEAEEAVREAAGRAHAAMDPATGELFRAVLFTSPGGTPARLLLTAHHLVVDGVSWRVLLEDLSLALEQAQQGAAITLEQPAGSFREWARRLHRHALDGGFEEEREYWAEIARHTDPPLPRDGAVGGPASGPAEASVSLTEAETSALLRAAPAAYRTRIDDLLLSALTRTLAEWTGRDRVVIALEGHGREDLFPELDLSRTVGWFTSYYPVALDAAPPGWEALVKSVKEQLRAVPRHGVGYGALRTLTAEGLPAGPAPRVSFNYLGQFPGAAPEHRPLRDTSGIGLHRPDGPGAHELDVVGAVRDGQFEVTWTAGGEGPGEGTLEDLADRFRSHLRDLVAHCVRPGSGGRTPSDFPLCGLDQAAVDLLAGDGSAVEDIYPLTPMQYGMLFHSLMDSRRGLYLEQNHFTLEGIGDTALLATAWQHAVDRNPVLRTALVRSGLPEPRQVVAQRAVLPVTRLDWRTLNEEQRRETADRYLVEDRARGLDLAVAPLMRVALADLGGDRVRVLWTFHHTLLDGWSAMLVLTEVLGEYAALAGGTPFAPVRRHPYGDYVRWLQEQDLSAAEAYWRAALTGLPGPTPLPYDRSPGDRRTISSSSQHLLTLPEDVSGRLYAAARHAGVTPNTLLLGMWALLLSSHGGDDVCFGTTASGRSAEVDGIEAMIGLFISTLPVRIRISEDAPLATWLRRIQEDQTQARQHEHAPLSRIRQWAPERTGPELFDSIMVFENYPVDPGTAREHGLRLRDITAETGTNYPLNAVVYADARLSVLLHYDPSVFDAATVERLGELLRGLLTAVTDAPEQTVGSLRKQAGGHPPRERAAASHGQPSPAEAEPDRTGSGAPGGAGTPSDPTEQAVAAIWSELLARESISTTDSFFDLGGDSLTSLRLMSRISHAFGVEVSLREFHDDATVTALAEQIKAKILTQWDQPLGDSTHEPV